MSHLFLGRSLPGGDPANPVVPRGRLPGLAVDLDRCIGCRACEVHCQLEHDLSPEIRLMRVLPFPEDPFPFGCAHCADPPCARVCPVGAIRRRDDGVVLLSEAECIGCRFCIIACPYGAPQYDRGRHRVVKCDLCADRLAQGLWPACATKCSMKAIHLLSPERLRRILTEARRRSGGVMAMDGLDEAAR